MTQVRHLLVDSAKTEMVKKASYPVLGVDFRNSSGYLYEFGGGSSL